MNALYLAACVYICASEREQVRLVKTQRKVRYRLTRGVDDRERRPCNRSDNQMSRPYVAGDRKNCVTDEKNVTHKHVVPAELTCAAILLPCL